MTPEVVIGRISALVDAVEKTVTDLKQEGRSLGETSIRMSQASSDIEDLREITLKLDDLVRRSQRTDWMTTAQTAAFLGVHVQTVRQMFRDGRLPGYRVGGRYLRFDRLEVEDKVKGDKSMEILGGKVVEAIREYQNPEGDDCA